MNYPSAYNNLTEGKFVAVPASADANADATGECYAFVYVGTHCICIRFLCFFLPAVLLIRCCVVNRVVLNALIS